MRGGGGRRRIGMAITSSVTSACGAAALATALLTPRDALAVDVEVKATTVAQGYEVASPWGDTILERRRVLQTLGLSAYHLQGDHVPGEADYNARFLFRLDADFGVNAHLEGAAAGGETNYDAASGARFVPGLTHAPLDLMYAYVEGENLFGGWFGFRIGRQYVTDVLGWWSFDGGLVRFTTPFFVQLEAYGGFEQRGGLPLSTSRYESQGIWRGSHADFGQGAGSPTVTDYPSYQYAQPAPAFGVAVESAGPAYLHGRFSFRRVYNQGASITQQFPDPSGGYRFAEGLRVSSDRLGYTALAPLLVYPDSAKWGALKGGFSYDLYSQLTATAFGGVEGYVTDRVTVGADFDYYEPTFDADSIWNWFTKNPTSTFLGRVDVEITERLDVSGSGGARLWLTDGDPDGFARGECLAADLAEDCDELGLETNPSSGSVRTYVRDEANRGLAAVVDGLGQIAGRYRFPSAKVEAQGMVQAGERGRRVGGVLSGRKRFEGGLYSLQSQVSLFDWTDPIREDRDATSFGYVLGGGIRPASFAELGVEWEHDMNRLSGQRYRVLALLNLGLVR